MRDSFIASHERPMRVLGMDVVAAVITLGFSYLFSGAYTDGWAISMTLALLLAIRRTWPILFLSLATVLAGMSFTMLYAIDLFAYIAVLIGVYGTAAFAPKKLRLIGFVPLLLAIAFVVMRSVLGWFPDAGVSGFLLPPGQGVGMVPSVMVVSVVSSIAFTAAWALGMLRRSQSMDVVRQRERADLLERDAHRLAELAVTDERTRISREMHDIIAHSLASILTLAEGGRMATREPEAELSNGVFSKISVAARDALSEVKVLLRQVDAEQEGRPAHGAQDIATLAEGASQAGQPLEFQQQGTVQELPTGLSLAVYRVAQETITNILKHAPGMRASLVLEWGVAALSLTTVNELAASDAGLDADPADGRGLVGMRERVELFDGELHVRRTEHVFEVRAEWPLRKENS